MKIDLHIHSCYSWDSSVPIETYIKKAEQHNFSVISITDHNNISSHAEIDTLQNKTDVLLIPGQEVSTTDGHLLVYGWVDKIEQNLPMEEAVKIAHKQDGTCIAAHPFDPFRGGSFSKIFKKGIDGFEVLNASAWFEFPNWLARRAHKSHPNLIGLANSDAHRVEEFGEAYSLLPGTEVTSLDQVLRQLHRAEPRGQRIGKIAKLSRFIRRKFY